MKAVYKSPEEIWNLFLSVFLFDERRFYFILYSLFLSSDIMIHETNVSGNRYPYATSVLPSNPALSLSLWCREKKADILGRSVHQFFAIASELRTLETLESHVTPLDMGLKGYLEMNSGLENTWPRLETRLTSCAIEGQDLLRYFISKYQYPFNSPRREGRRRAWLSLFLITMKN